LAKPFYKKPIFYILLFSLLLHLVFLVKEPGTIFKKPEAINFTEEQGKWGGRDASLYAKMANQIIEEGVYGYDTKHTGEVVKNAFVTPGHPMYLVTTFFIANTLNIDQLLLVRIFNMLLSVATVLLVYLIAKKLFQKELIALSSAFLYATYFSPLHYFRTALTEIPGIFMLCLTILFFLKAFESDKTRNHILFAIFFCIAVMIRPTPAPLILLAIAAVLWKYGIKKSVRIGLLWAVGPLVVILPWVIRNYIAFGELYIFSSHAGNSLYAGSNPFFVYNNSDYYREMLKMGLDQSQYALYKIKQGFSNNFAIWFSWFTVGKTIELFKYVDGYVHYYYYKGFKLLELQHFFVVIAGFLSAFIFRKRKGMLPLLFILVGYIALSNLFLTIPRYGFYIIPVICIIAGYGVSQLIYFLLKKNKMEVSSQRGK
jgi:4-amino-4-deoxy-L-arabinose transferase-like glycosyltransferase